MFGKSITGRSKGRGAKVSPRKKMAMGLRSTTGPKAKRMTGIRKGKSKLMTGLSKRRGGMASRLKKAMTGRRRMR